MAVISNISSAATVPPDFTTPTAWESWAQGEFGTTPDEYIADCYNDFGGPLEGSTVIAGWATTDAVNHPTIRAATGQGHAGVVGDGFTLKYSEPNASNTLSVNIPYTEIRDITIVRETTSTTSVEAINLNGCSNSTVERNIIQIIGSVVRKHQPIDCQPGTDNVIIRNNLIIGDAGTQKCNIGIRATSNAGMIIENNTLTGCDNIGIREDVFSGSFVNNIAYNNGTDYSVGGTPTTSASGDGSAGTTVITGADFVDFPGGDYRPAPGGLLENTGSDLSTQFRDDITGTADIRPVGAAWEIGAYEIAAAAADFDDTNPFTITIASAPISLVSETGTYNYSGGDSTLTLQFADLTADTGVYGYSGGDSNAIFTPVLASETGVYGYSGGDSAIVLDLTVTLDTGEYNYFGGNSALSFPDIPTLESETGVYGYAGGDSLLREEGAPLTAETGVFGYDGGDSTLTTFLAPLSADTGVYGYDGGDSDRAFGVLAQDVPSTGRDGPAFMYPQLVFPADTDKFVDYEIIDPVDSGAFVSDLTSAFTWADNPNTEFFTFTMRVDGVPRGGEITVSLRTGAP